jgi:hypothetical protein
MAVSGENTRPPTGRSSWPLTALAGVVGPHGRNAGLAVVGQAVRRQRGALFAPQPRPLREVLALDPDRAADGVVAIASAAAGTLA